MSIESQDIISKVSSVSVVGNLLDRMDESISSGFMDNHLDHLGATTKKHSLETAVFFNEVIKQYKFNEETTDALILGALLHDAGKTIVPAEFLYSSKPMNADAIRLMKSHSENGALIINRVSEYDLASENPNFKLWQWDTAIAIASLHHSFKNETKFCYPKEPVVKELVHSNVVAQKTIDVIRTSGIGEMFAVCDVFSAVSAGRPYSKRRLDGESLLSPGDCRYIEEKCNSISDVVRYEIKLSRLGEGALDRLSEYYCFNCE